MSGSPKVLLAVIDMQVGSLKPHMGDFPERIAAFIPRWREKGGEVAFFRFINYPGSPCERFLDWAKMQGPPETELCDPLAPLAETVYDKMCYTALTPEFLSVLKEKDWDTIACCGIDTAACIQKTALDIFDLGKRPFVIEDLCASGAGGEAHDSAIVALRRSVGERQVGTSDDALRLLDPQ